MCGVTGFFVKNDTGISKKNLINATAHIHHRGPDSEGYFTKTINGTQQIANNESEITNLEPLKIGIGFKRLSILDVEKGSQPFASPDGRYIAVFNGEIYNYKELKRDLENWDFKTSSDGEIIIPLYKKYGTSFTNKLNGMFAICIYDTKLDELTLIRDQIGIKPLYIYEDEGIFAFSSEIKSLLEIESVEKRMNREAIYNYLTFQNIFGKQTLFKNIELMENGTVIHFAKNQRKDFSYWSYSDNDLSMKYSKNNLIEHLTKAVSSQLISDVPIGTYLSSGIDTSTITSLANQSEQRFAAITCGYENSQISPEYGLDEKELAKVTSKNLSIDHFTYLLKKPSLADTLYKTIFHLDEPKMGYSYQNLIISNATSNHFKVVLSGVGSDELFGGYPWRYDFVKNNTIDRDAHFNWWSRVVSKDETSKAFSNNSFFKNNYNPRESYEQQISLSSQSTALSTIFAFEFNTFLQGLLVVEDKLSMANSLESRVPFLDIDLVNYIIAINPEEKFQQKNGKILLKDAIKNIVPNNVLNNPKVGFVPPVEYWNENENQKFISKLLDKEKIHKYEIFNADYVEELKLQFFNKDYSIARKFWSILSIQAWLDIFFSEELNHESFYNFDYKNTYEREY